MRFVVSLRLGEPPTLDPVTRRLERYPSLRFKLDPTTEWTPELIAELVATGAVDSVDFKGLYVGSIVDQPADPVLYRRVVDAFPDAWIEDPKLTEETDAILLPHRDRITWDAPIHGVADIEALPFPPRMVNVKPSRLGPLRSLFAAYEYCEARGIGMYGGGQFELGPGRGHIQYLASIFHPDTPNDVAPGGYNDPDVPRGCRTARWSRWRTTRAFAGASRRSASGEAKPCVAAARVRARGAEGSAPCRHVTAPRGIGCTPCATASEGVVRRRAAPQAPAETLALPTPNLSLGFA